MRGQDRGTRGCKGRLPDVRRREGRGDSRVLVGGKGREGKVKEGRGEEGEPRDVWRGAINKEGQRQARSDTVANFPDAQRDATAK